MIERPSFLREDTNTPDAAPTDVLSDVLEQVEVQGIMTGGFAVRGPWVSRGAISRPLKLVALVAGSAEVSTDGSGGPDGPVHLGPGDVVLLNHRTRLEVRGGGCETELVPEASFDAMALSAADLRVDTVLLGGWVKVNPTGLAVIGQALPGLVHVRAATPEASRLSELVHHLFEEASGRRLGSAFAMRQSAAPPARDASVIPRPGFTSCRLAPAPRRPAPRAGASPDAQPCRRAVGLGGVGSRGWHVSDEFHRPVPYGGGCPAAHLPDALAHAARSARSA